VKKLSRKELNTAQTTEDFWQIYDSRLRAQDVFNYPKSKRGAGFYLFFPWLLPFKLIKEIAVGHKRNDPVLWQKRAYATYQSNNIWCTDFRPSRARTMGEANVENIKKFVYPLWKRQGTTLTYLQCGNSLVKEKKYDEAIMSYYGGLLTIDNIFVPPTYKEYLRMLLFSKIENACRLNAQNNIAALFSRFIPLAKSMSESSILRQNDQEIVKLSDEVSRYSTKLNMAALEANTAKITNSMLAIESMVGALATSYSGTLQNSPMLSAQSDAFVNQAAELLANNPEIDKEISEVQKISEKAFNQNLKEHSDILNDAKSSYSSNKPYLALYLAQILNRKELAMEVKDVIRDIFQNDNSMFLILNEYYENIENQFIRRENAKKILLSFSKTEMGTFLSESGL